MISRATRPAPLAGQGSNDTLSAAGADSVGTSVGFSTGSVLAGAADGLAAGGLGAGPAAAITFGEPSIFFPGAPTSMKGISSASSVSSTTGAAGLGSDA